MKIGIIGTHCSGKTTLIDTLYKNILFKEYEFLEEPIREISRARFKINKESDDAAQLAMLACHLRNLQNKNFISDRSILDLFIYCATLDSVTDDTKDYIFKKTLEYIDQYDFLFWCAPEFPLKDDGFRVIDKEWQDEIENGFQVAIAYFKTHDILKHCKIIRLEGETVDRAKKVIQEVHHVC